LLVGGEVIGSVLVGIGGTPTDADRRRVDESVAQAAPVLANLRNLALAERRAATDALTGLPNKRAVDDSLKRMAAQASRTASPLSAIFLDLDHFKRINDTYGHLTGDEVLAAVAVAIAEAVRQSDTVGRFGGEEFVVLLPATGGTPVLAIAERVRVAVGELSVVVGGTVQVSGLSVSIGVAGYPDAGDTLDQVLRSADAALYRAKDAGRNRVAV
jgi:diguanylate cyclase (GGDEF)-like protein